jgi:hypothetical protein
MSSPKRNVFANFQHDQKPKQYIENTVGPWRFTRSHVPVTLVPARSDSSAIVWCFSLTILTSAFGVGRLPWVKGGPLQVILCKSDIGKPRY